jgi:hypothetical protein
VTAKLKAEFKPQYCAPHLPPQKKKKKQRKNVNLPTLSLGWGMAKVVEVQALSLYSSTGGKISSVCLSKRCNETK